LRVLFTVIPEKGHLNPCIPVAQVLVGRGHTVAFHSAADIRPQLRRAGLPLFIGEPPAPEPPAASRGRRFAEQIRDAAWLRGWIKSLLIDAVPAQIEPLRGVLREFRPDVVVSDPMAYASIIAAELERVPWVALSNSLNPVLPPGLRSELLDTVEWLRGDRRGLFERYGVAAEFRGCDCLSPRRTICFTTRDFVGDDVPGVSLVGPSLPRGERGDEPSETALNLPAAGATRLIFASFGSQIYFQPRRFKLLAEALGDDPSVRAVFSVGELVDDAALGPLPANVTVARYVPQLDVLRRADLFVTHGGANSVMEGLAHGVPLLVAPICNDQFHQAWFVKRAGVGDELLLDELDAAGVRRAVHRVLESHDVRSACARIASSYQVDGAARAADVIESVAG
jgi:UDP:flavonoid glycosyltransferase YjiC (YdhE family)